MQQRIPSSMTDFFSKEIIRMFKSNIKMCIANKRVIRKTKVLMRIDEGLLVPRRFIVITKTNKAYRLVKSILEDLGFRREIPSCRHYLLGTIISVKIERPNECEIYENYKRPGEWSDI